MGNKLEGKKSLKEISSENLNSKENSKFSTPKKLNKSQNSQNDILEKSPDSNLKKKDSLLLYSEEKLFENFENTNIYGLRLDSDPETREYFYDCPNCGKLLLDKGILKEIK